MTYSRSNIQTINIHDLCDVAVQVRFCPSDITFKTMKTMDNAARLAMMPDYEMFCADLTEGVHIHCETNLDVE